MRITQLKKLTSLNFLSVAHITVPLPENVIFGVNLGTAGTAGVASYESWLDRPVDFVQLHTGRADWTDYVSSVGFLGNLYGNTRTYHWSIPLFITGATLANAVAGSYDTYWHDALASALAWSPGENAIFLRTGWEMNLSGQPWYSYGNEATFISAWQRFANIAYSISPRFKMVWCPNFEVFAAGPTLIDPELSYPGDNYVDVISMDFYVNFGAGGFTGNPANAITYYFGTGSRRFPWLISFAAAHGKPVAVDEWGVSSDGFETFIAYAANYFRTNNFLYVNWWESSSGYNSKLSDGSYPTTGAQFIKDFGSPIITSSNNSTIFSGSALSYSLTTSCTRPVIWSVVGNTGVFSLTGSTLSTANNLAQNTYSVSVKANDTYYHLDSDVQTFSLTVAAPAVLWTPLELSTSLRRFFTATDFSGTNDGTAVSTWTDHSSQAKDATQVTGGNQPLKQTRNSKPSIVFDGTDDFLQSTTTGLPTGTNVSTIFAVANMTATGNGNREVVSLGSALAGQLRSISGNFSRIVTGSVNGAGNDHASAISWIGADKIVCWSIDPAATTSESSMNVDGGTTLTLDLTGTAINTAVANMFIGQRAGNANRWLGGIQCVVVVNRTLTTTERQKLEGWAAWEYNLVSLLPSGHPYKTSAPTV